MMNTQTKILLLVFAGLVLVFLLYNGRTEKFCPGGGKDGRIESDDHNLPRNMEDTTNPTEGCVMSDGQTVLGSTKPSVSMDPTENQNKPISQEDMIKYFPQKDYSPPESDWLVNKFMGRNKAMPGEYKRSSYSGGRRGALGPSDWSDYFDHNNNVIGNSETGDNDQFLPIDESNGGFAVFRSKGRATCGSNQNCEPEDLYDVDKYLPQEVNDDWFEVQPEPISVKNRHLINITKPIGINTIGTSLRNASWDIRGAPSCPKYVVSPWLQSSIEPDTNLKPLF